MVQYKQQVKTYLILPWYCIQTLTRHSWIHYTDWLIVK